MEETTAKVFARLHRMKSVLYRTFKRSSCGTIPNHDGTYYSSQSDESAQTSQYSLETDEDMPSSDTISSISDDSLDSGVSTLSDFSHNSLSSSTLLLNRTNTLLKSNHLRCDPSIINYISHHLLTTQHSELFLDESGDQTMHDTPSTRVPLAESSRRTVDEHDEAEQTLVAETEDEHTGPLTSTFIDRWHVIAKSYSATFREDLTVRKSELVQVLRSTHPHWIWIRNEHSQEGFIPTDCLASS